MNSGGRALSRGQCRQPKDRNAVHVSAGRFGCAAREPLRRATAQQSISCGRAKPTRIVRIVLSDHTGQEAATIVFRSVLSTAVLKERNVRKSWLCAAAICSQAVWSLWVRPTADATLCGSIGGRFVDVTGCSDPLSYLNDALPPPPPPPPPPGAATTAAAPASATTGATTYRHAERRRVRQRGQAYQRQWLHLASA